MGLSKRLWPWILLAAGCIGLSSCTTPLPVTRPAVDTAVSTAATLATACTDYLGALQKIVTQAGVRDAQAAPVLGFPYLRVDRFLASYRQDTLSDAAFAAWVDRMQARAEEAWRIEIANLPPTERQALAREKPAGLAGEFTVVEIARACAGQLRVRDLAHPATREKLQTVARVPPAYRTGQRVVGLYYLSIWPVLHGVHRWQEETLAEFRKPLNALPVGGQLLHFGPPPDIVPLNATDVQAVLERSANNPLGIPEPQGPDRERLFATFAPVWAVDMVSDADRIGRVRWAAETAAVDIERPTVYRHLSHTRLGSQTLLQLNYTVWFPERPVTSSLDLLGGHLDGITWRVTLSPEGQPLIYDTIHNCGCYHLFFPTERVTTIPDRRVLQEDTFIPQTAPLDWRLSLRIAHTSHYVQRVTGAEPQDTVSLSYAWADYASLRSLPLPSGGRRSLFGPKGIVAGTDRKERWVLWPMGVPHPGAMRQWGHHATAFVGRRHFDDPLLFAEHFTLTPAL